MFCFMLRDFTCPFGEKRHNNDTTAVKRKFIRLDSFRKLCCKTFSVVLHARSRVAAKKQCCAVVLGLLVAYLTKVLFAWLRSCVRQPGPAVLCAVCSLTSQRCKNVFSAFTRSVSSALCNSTIPWA